MPSALFALAAAAVIGLTIGTVSPLALRVYEVYGRHAAWSLPHASDLRLAVALALPAALNGVIGAAVPPARRPSWWPAAALPIVIHVMTAVVAAAFGSLRGVLVAQCYLLFFTPVILLAGRVGQFMRRASVTRPRSEAGFDERT